jgi:N-acetylglutamate synthase-like GNAT family acetyltransferase
MDYKEWLGYLASLIVLISLLMSSVKKLRWINMIGSLTFAVYGFLIDALPVAVMNTGIVGINIYYLIQMYRKNDYFTLTPLDKEKDYFEYFMAFYKEDIQTFITEEHDLKDETLIKLFVLRNTVPAGIFVAKKIKDDQMHVFIDYVTPQYRDFKIGEYLFNTQKKYFIEQGIKSLLTHPGTEKHEKYLQKMGFSKKIDKDEVFYIKEIK